MAYPPHVLIAFGGILGVTEEWSCSLRATSTAYQALDRTTRINTLIGTAGQVSGYMNSLLHVPQFSGQAACSWVKVNAIGTDGKYESSETNVARNTETFFGVGQGAVVPFQIAIVASFRTAVSRGIGSRGRIYLPAGISTVDSSGQITAEDAQAVADRVAAFINQVNTALASSPNGGSPRVSIVSPGAQTSVSYDPGTGKKHITTGPGAFHPITQVRVGRVLDTQRRRRADAPEGYQTSTVAIA